MEVISDEDEPDEDELGDQTSEVEETIVLHMSEKRCNEREEQDNTKEGMGAEANISEGGSSKALEIEQSKDVDEVHAEDNS